MNHMDRGLYSALIDDDVDFLRGKEWLEVCDQLTPTNNSVLHVACQHGSHKCVQEILERADESLLFKPNSRGETALHLAARQGHYVAVKPLISKAKSSDQQSDDLENTTTALQNLIRAPNVEFETALHAAVRYNHEKVVGVLVKADPGYSYPRNKSDETPLYLAAARGYAGVTKVILDNCESPTFGGPHGRTALHAALMSFRGRECMRLLVRSNPDLTDVLDNNGWSAFHFAADNDLPYSVDFLLSWANINVAYIADKKYKKTAFHVAAYKGYTNVIEKFLEYLPDIVDSVDGNGQNILHIAIKQNQNFLLKFILSKTWKFDTLNTLMIQKDIEGNTPLHLIAKLGYYIPELREWIQKTDQEVVDNTNLTPSEALYQYYSPVIRDDEEVGGVHPKRDNFYYFWNDWCGGKLTFMDRSDLRSVKVRIEMLTQQANTHMIVAALVTTVALTAGFAMPGGFNGTLGPDQGSPLLLRKPAFNIFVVADTVALLFSISSLFLYFSLSFHRKKKAFFTLFAFAVTLNIASIAAMMVAFIAGTYAVLSHSLVLAIAVSFLSSLFLLLVFPLSYRTFITMLRVPIGRIRSWLRPVYRNIRNYYGNLVFVRRRPPFDIDFVRRPSSPASDGHSSSVRTDSSV
ncbi:hypothetical protein DCAR_0104748 [Daucus carota subsp. sativus]|uniref:PGG domain-containing protein n=1 Tax=Daucus carota subsp. sativus TaxID=79200 RepID=A0AAF0W9W5_DAUCS|nr:PREDICTED: ankyrin repeat-containing protein At5g02620-like [Daucus carota subsp. sativus]WOG85557.1 hypothetical protein DCAR_0104748 [Daucus carota subsp. sativus]